MGERSNTQEEHEIAAIERKSPVEDFTERQGPQIQLRHASLLIERGDAR
jgi:hypothetical protein